MSLRLVKKAPCYPVTLDEVRRYLTVDASSHDMDMLIESLIEAATDDAEAATSCVWIESVWEWDSEMFVGTEPIEFPICPVTKVEVYDLDEVVPEESTPTDISSTVCRTTYPSLEPLGKPLIGSLLPLGGFPSKHRVLLTVGYPVDKTETVIEQKDDPVLVPASTTYTKDKIHLVFNRAVIGDADAADFTVALVDGDIQVEEVLFEHDGLSLVFAPDVLKETPQDAPLFAVPRLSFIQGLIYDQFGNYVQVISEQQLPAIIFKEDADFAVPDPAPVREDFTGKAPAAVRQWIFARTGTLYNQRSEIALRAGKSNDGLFPDAFINNSLKKYKRRFF